MIARKLPGLPPYGKAAKNFPKADAFSEGLVVEFTPMEGERWVGNFAAGRKSLECIRDDLGEGAVLVVAGGDVYLVDTWKQRVIFELPWVTDIRFEPDLELFVIADNCEVTALGQSGIKWRSRRVSWDGITELERVGRSLHGLAFDIHDQPPVPFVIDLETGHATGGSYQVSSERVVDTASRQQGRPKRRSPQRMITGWKAILFAPVLIPIGFIAQLWPSARKVDRTPGEVAGFLRDFLDGTCGEWDWDGFETTPIKDPELDWIRKRAAMVAPPDPDLGALRELLTEAEQIVERRAVA